MIKVKNCLIKLLIATMAVAFTFALVNFTVIARKSSADATELDGVSMSSTKYLESTDGNYMLLTTAFSADDVLDDTENDYIIGYEIDGNDALNGYGKTYYNTVSVKTSAGAGTPQTAEDIFGSSYSGNYLNVYEIEDFDATKLYTVRSFIKQITPSGVSGYTVDKTAYGNKYAVNKSSLYNFDAMEDGTVISDSDNLTGEIGVYYDKNGTNFCTVEVNDDVVYGGSGKSISADLQATNWGTVRFTNILNYKNQLNGCANADYDYLQFRMRLTSDGTATLTANNASYKAFTNGDRIGTAVSLSSDDTEWTTFYFPLVYILHNRFVFAFSGSGTLYIDDVKLISASEVQYVVSFDTLGGTAVASQVVNGGSTVSTPATPAKTGLTFDGWDRDLSVPITDITTTGKITVTATYSVHADAEYDISSLFTWKNNYGAYANTTNQYIQVGQMYWTETYKYSILDVSAYQGRVLKITMPKTTGYGLVFSQNDILTTDSRLSDIDITAENQEWYYYNSANADGYIYVRIPTVDSGNVYIKATYRKDNKIVSTDENTTTFSAIILNDCADNDVSGLVSGWTNNYGIYLNYANVPAAFAMRYWSETYKYTVFDVTAFKGRTIRITLPASGAWGLAFSTNSDATVQGDDVDNKREGWYFINSDYTDYVDIVIPSTDIAEGSKLYIKTSYRKDGKIRSTDETTSDFSAIILAETAE